MGWHPFITFFGYQTDWYCSDFLRTVYDTTIVHITANVNIFTSSEMSFCTAAQVSRLYYGMRDASFYIDNDYILTSDIDMWPIKESYFNSYDPKKFTVWASNLYEDARPIRYPICYLSGPSYLWNDIMNLKYKGAFLKDWDEYDKNNIWNYDEILIGKKLSEYKNQNDIRYIFRNYTGDRRIDRESWYYPENMDLITDAHLPRIKKGFRNWYLISSLFKRLAPEAEWVDDYIKKLKECKVI